MIGMLNDIIKNAIDEIGDSQKYSTTPEIIVNSGSQAGDGYASKTYAISINPNDENKAIELFVKYYPDTIENNFTGVFIEAFQGEYRFYNKIYPAFRRFEESRGIKEPFSNIPKHYPTNLADVKIPPIILENLRKMGYAMRNRKNPIDDAHLKLPIEAFAKYHAISYAVKDQDPKLFKELTNDMYDYFCENFTKYNVDDMTRNCINQFCESLDPVVDKTILERCENLSDIINKHIMNLNKLVDEYAVIMQGDCWSNNMMFLYDNSGAPIDVKLIDWQMQRVGSPLLDFSYFFYTLANKDVLDKADHYLDLYYKTLSSRIRELGSDPEKMYPYEVFIEHWRKNALFGLTMAFSIIKAQLFEEDEYPDMINAGEDAIQGFAKVGKNHDQYLSRIKDLIVYFINKDFI